MKWSWELENWPNYTYDRSKLEDRLERYTEKVSFLGGAIHGLAKLPKLEVQIYQMAVEGSASSKIEGLNIKVEDIKASIANNLRPDLGYRRVHDQRATNLASIVAENHLRFSEPLTHQTLFDWHTRLVAHRKDLKVGGGYRTGKEKMQIVSGSLGKETVHFEAPPSGQVPQEMDRYLDWFNGSLNQYSTLSSSVIRSGLAHLYFESIHPFEDGNGRIGRVVAERALAQGLGYALPFSLSYSIFDTSKLYYLALQNASRKLDATEWLEYYTDTCLKAIERGKEVLAFTVQKVQYMEQYGDSFSQEEEKAIVRMFAAGPEGFEGGMTAKKYRHLTGVSPATATRDLTKLSQAGALIRRGAGRSVHYVLPSG